MTGNVLNAYGGNSYEYAVGSIKASAHPPLTKEQWARLREADTATAEKLLSEYGYPVTGDGKTVFDSIESEKERMTGFVRELAPDGELTSTMFFEEDALNLKLLMKARLTGADSEKLPFVEGNLQPELLRICVASEDTSLLGEGLDKLLFGIFELNDATEISCRIDSAMFLNAVETAKKKHCKPLETLFTVYGKGRNRITAKRLQSLGYEKDRFTFAFLPVESTGLESADETKSEAEILADVGDRLSGIMTELGYESGMGPIAEYYFTKKNEAAALRLMFAGKSLDEAKNAGGVTE